MNPEKKPEPEDDDNDLNIWVYESTLPAWFVKLVGDSFRPPNGANVGVGTVVGGKDDNDRECGLQVGGNYYNNVGSLIT